MKQTESTWQWWVKCLAYLLAATLACICLLSVVLTRAAPSDSSMTAWGNPSSMAIKRISSLGSTRNEPVLWENLDCNQVTYRQAATDNMRTGCFTETAFGLMDGDSSMVIFNGTDEGIPLLAYTPHQVLGPWPKAMDLISTNAAVNGGSYISLYKNPALVMQDQRNLLLQLTAKKLTAPPDLPLRDRAGQLLIINPESLAFSDGGSWMAAETLGGSFVRINLATLDILPFAQSFASQGSPALYKSRVALSHDGHFVAIASDAADSLNVYDLTSCSHTSVNLNPESCQFYDYRPFLARQISGLQSVRHVRFISPELISFEARTGNPATDGTYVMAPRDSIRSLTGYLGLGDSFTSGEGAFDYLAGTDTADNPCHLSARSYPVLLTRDLFSAQGGHSVACSGAVIKDVGSTSDNYRGQARNSPSLKDLRQNQATLLDSIMANFTPGYVPQQNFVSQYQPAVVSVSIGGNDVGFGDILERCVVPRLSLHLSDGTCFNTYEDRLEIMRLVDKTVPRWTTLYRQLLAKAPGTRLYAIGYSSVAFSSGNCGTNVHLDKSELEFSEELIAYINSGTQKSAHQAGIVYVDISQALVGHRLCEASSSSTAVNGLTAGKDAGFLGLKVFGKESYHPNALGQALIEQAILKQTRNFTTTAAAADNSGTQALLKTPKSGRAVHTRVPATPNITQKVIKRGSAARVKVTGADAGLKPKTTHHVRLDGSSGHTIGTVSSDDNGDIDTVITIPSDITPGSHTIDLTGENQAGEPVEVTQPIYVPVSDTDADGDGIADSGDSCPAAANSGQDTDQDGIDDTCDGLISQPSQVNVSPSSGVSTGSISTTTGDGMTGTLEPGPVTTVAKITVNKPPAAAILSVPDKPAATLPRPRLRGLQPKTPQAYAKIPSIKLLPLAKGLGVAWLLLVLIIFYLANLIDRRKSAAYS